jgi:hypothetical protein
LVTTDPQKERNMTTPVLPTDTGQLGPGVLKIGETGTEIDVSCYLNNAAIEWSDSTTDPTTKLCGAERAGVTTFTSQLTGNIDVDAGNDAGFFALSWAEKGSQVSFEFTPSTELGTKATGTLTLKPLRFGADAYGDDLTSDFAFDIIGDPTLSFDGAPVGPATGATAGTPGTWTPSGATPPATWGVANSNSVTASPTTAWTTGQYMQGSTASTPGEMYWNGTAWALGKAA